MDITKVKRNIKPFDGERYSIWKFRINALLVELDVMKVISQESPDTPDTDWKKSENTAKSVIVEYLADSLLGFAKPNSTAKEIFKSLDAIYERKSLATQLAIRKKLLGLKLQGDTTLIKHFMTFDDLIAELLAAGAKLDETDKVSHLLLTLPSSYDGVITAIETLSENSLTLAFVKTRLLDQEIKLKNESADTSAKVLHVGNQESFTYKRNNRNNFKSWKNNKKYQIKKNNFKFNKNKNYKCHHCGRKGHLIKDCYYHKRRIEHQRNEKIVHTAETREETTEKEEQQSFAFMVGNNPKYNNSKLTFLLDSGASDHIINVDTMFSNYKELQPPVKISVAKSGSFITATKKGTVQVISNLGIFGTLQDVLYCPESPYNLLSVLKMQQAGITTTFNSNGVEISKNGISIMRGKPLNNLTSVEFEVNNKVLNESYIQVFNVINNNYEIWHQRLGHISKGKFLQLKNKIMVDDLTLLNNIEPSNDLCEACLNGKQARLPFEKAKDKSYIKRPLFIIHSDVCGPITPSTVDNKNYFVLFIDEYTHYLVTYLITYKSDVFSAFKDFIAKSETHFNLKIVNLYCDNGREYLSNEMKQFCVEKGISYHLTVPRTPQLNGVSERMVRTVTEKARAMLNSAKLNQIFWGEAVLTATYLINLTPTKALNVNKTPYELWHNKKPKLTFLKIFGSTAYIHNKVRKTKFDEKSWKGILVGYEPNGYKVWDVSNEKFVIVRDVIFDEINYLKSRPIKLNERVYIEGSMNETGVSDKTAKPVSYYKLDCETGASDCMLKPVENDKSDNCKPDELNKSRSENSSTSDDIQNVVQYKTDKLKPNEKVILNEQNKNENLSHTTSGKILKETEIRRSDRLKQKPLQSYNEYEIDYDYILIAKSINCKVPISFNEIKNRDDKNLWEQAIRDEIDSLIKNKTWTLVPMPDNKNIVDCKWVFAIKNDEFGKPLKYKARLVARGFSQQYLIDYNETFAPVARISSFRFIVAFANQNNLIIHHMDVKTAFLNGQLREEIYMKIPDGIECKNNYVCKLNKAIYGLKQAARCWFETFEKTLTEKGFRNSEVDRCIYILDKGNISENIYVVLYVDDLVIATANCHTMNNFKNYLKHKFCMTDLKEIKLFLGIKVERSNNKLYLDQSAYIKTVLEKFNMHESKSVSTPLPSKLDYVALNSDEQYDAPCRNLIGCLMYIMVCTRPDLSTAVNILSRYTNKNNKELWQNLKHVLRYLKGSIDIKLVYEKCDYNNILIGYVDSDWGGSDTNDRKSTTGYLFKLFDKNTICWNTKRQSSVAASSTEAEYMALFEAVREALWLKSLAASINIILSEPIVIFEDNNGCISIANNPTCHKRSKHIDIKYHFSREQIEKNVIKVTYISTGKQIADVLTKPLPAVKFLEFRTQIGLQ